MAKIGRPKAHILTDQELAEIARLAGLGLPHKSIAYVVGIAERTFERYKATDPRLLAAVEKGKADAAGQVANRLWQMATDGNLGAIVWYEKTRCDRFERSRHEMTGADGAPIQTEDTGPSPREQIDRELDRLASRAGTHPVELRTRRNGGS